MNTAINQATNADMTVDIINVIRKYAVGAPLINHEDRIKQAVAKLKANHNFGAIELGWLKMIEANLLQENVLSLPHDSRNPLTDNSNETFQALRI